MTRIGLLSPPHPKPYSASSRRMIPLGTRCEGHPWFPCPAHRNTRALVRRIVEIAESGERESIRLRDRALRQFGTAA